MQIANLGNVNNHSSVLISQLDLHIVYKIPFHHYRKMLICRELDRFLSANYRAHGKCNTHRKSILCRLLVYKHTTHIWHTAKQTICRVQDLKKHDTCMAHGKIANLPCAHTCPRQNKILPCAFLLCRVHGKLFGKMPSKLFLLCTHCTWYSMLNFGMFLDLFAIFSHFILLNGFPGISQI